MQQILTACANLPIFWQFVGVGGSNYGVLEKLDTMTGRVVDNCNFLVWTILAVSAMTNCMNCCLMNFLFG